MQYSITGKEASYVIVRSLLLLKASNESMMSRGLELTRYAMSKSALCLLKRRGRDMGMVRSSIAATV